VSARKIAHLRGQVRSERGPERGELALPGAGQSRIRHQIDELLTAHLAVRALGWQFFQNPHAQKPAHAEVVATVGVLDRLDDGAHPADSNTGGRPS